MTTKIGELSRSVSIIGTGVTPFGYVNQTPEIKDMTERELFAWASIEAMENAGLESKDIEAFFIAHVFDETLSHTIGDYGVMADWIGMRNKPGFHHEAACASTNVGLRHAVTMVASGVHDIVLSGGVEISSCRPMDGKPAHIREAMNQGELWYKIDYGADQAYWYPTGKSGGVDEFCVSYAKKYGLTLQQMHDTMAHAAINNRYNGVRNPLATFAKKEFKDEAKERGFDDPMDYMKSKYNAKIGLVYRPFFGAITADGASALIVCPTEMAKKITDDYVEVIGFGSAAACGYHNMDDVTGAAFEQAYKMAGIKDPYHEVDYMHVHDCNICMQFVDSEIGGYFKPGEAWSAIQEGRTRFDGDKPLSTSGGRNSMGHAFAASGGAEIAEAVNQMLGKCGARQVKKQPEISVVHNFGHGINANVTVLRAHN